MRITRREVIGAGVAGVAMSLTQMTTAEQQREPEPGHVVLLGDSILDNGVYVKRKHAVIDQLRAALPNGWKATLAAVDGDVALSVLEQVEKVPRDATHLILSVGGNDALQASGIFAQQVKSGAEAFLEMSKIRKKFTEDYDLALSAVLGIKLPTAVCTIYDPNFPLAFQQQMSICGLSVFNDCITRAAIMHKLPIIDLRLLFTAPADYANTIEPSPVGGAKIVREIVRIVTSPAQPWERTTVFAGV